MKKNWIRKQRIHRKLFAIADFCISWPHFPSFEPLSLIQKVQSIGMFIIMKKGYFYVSFYSWVIIIITSCIKLFLYLFLTPSFLRVYIYVYSRRSLYLCSKLRTKSTFMERKICFVKFPFCYSILLSCAIV